MWRASDAAIRVQIAMKVRRDATVETTRPSWTSRYHTRSRAWRSERVIDG